MLMFVVDLLIAPVGGLFIDHESVKFYLVISAIISTCSWLQTIIILDSLNSSDHELII
jgi:hypothetical protein